MLSKFAFLTLITACGALCAHSLAALPLYEQLIQRLRTDTAVVAAPRDVHPSVGIYNQEAIIPPQCYTKTQGRHNPCYVCHQDAISGRENVMNDGDLQLEYSFSDLGMTNHWRNLYEDRSRRVAKISDEEIIKWINQDNYSELAERLRGQKFEGWIPDLEDLQQGERAFDEHGFALDGSHWVAFNYKPMPSTFWPTNGSTDDVMIRLQGVYREDRQGRYSRDVYQANLAILEANIKGLSEISTPPIDERAIGADLNGDDELTLVERIDAVDAWVGAAKSYYLDTHTYPQHTEFLHTVRYVGFDRKGQIRPSTRIKEVRYMRKWQTYDKGTISRYYQLEQFEKELGHMPQYALAGDHGLDNGMGWSIQGFIEGVDGRLRVATYEENLFCMGCHNSIGSTIDKTFSFARKIDGARGWGYIDLKGMPDAPNMGERQGEILTYLQRVGGGGEFRSNPEMYERWFGPNGEVDADKVQAADVYALITPSRERALTLNKAYRVLVEDQDYIFGRDATVEPPANVYDRIDNRTAPTLEARFAYDWDIRLDWSASPQH